MTPGNGHLPMRGPIRSLLGGVLQRSLRATGAPCGNVQLVNWQTGALEIVLQHGFDAEFLEHFRWVKPSDGTACGLAAQLRRDVIVADLECNKELAPLARTVMLARGIRAVHSLPLISTSGEIGRAHV